MGRPNQKKSRQAADATRSVDYARAPKPVTLAVGPTTHVVPASAIHTWVPIVLIFLVTCATFSRGYDYPFVSWDDGPNLQGNVNIRGFSTANIEWMLTSSLLGVWQPLSWAVAALQWVLFANKAQTGYMEQWSAVVHTANIVLHATVAVMCFFMVRRLMVLGMFEKGLPSATGLAVGATLAGLLFAIHPLRVESVTWATAQPYILAMIGCLGTVLCYLRANEPGRNRIAWHAGAVTCLVLSLLCKSIAVPLIAVLFVLDVYPLRRIGGRAGWNGATLTGICYEKIPYIVVTAAAVGMALWATHTERKYAPEPFQEKLLVASYCMMFYVSITFVPWKIAPYYWKGMPFVASDPIWGGAAALLVVVTLAAILLRRRCPWLLAAWTCYFVVLLPVVGFVKHGGQMAADRYTYLSCIPWALLVGAALTRIWDASARRNNSARFVASAAAVLICAGLGVMTWRLIPVWRDSISVWTAMVERNPTWWMGYYNLAKPWKEKPGGREMARKYYEKAIFLYPNYPEANIDLGNMYKTEGKLDIARKHYEASLRGRPGFHMALFHLATIEAAEGKLDSALQKLIAADADARKLKETHRYGMIAAEIARVQALIDARNRGAPPPPGAAP